MSEMRYDTPINEVASILDKSDRQVRRYVKEKRLKAKPVRVDGHIKLMFDKQEVETFKERFLASGVFGDSGHEILVDAQYIKDDSVNSATVGESTADVAPTVDVSTVKYVIDALKEQIGVLQNDNRELHYQLEQRSGHVGFLQGQIETLQQELKMLAPVPRAEVEKPRVSWWRSLFGGDKTEQAESDQV